MNLKHSWHSVFYSETLSYKYEMKLSKYNNETTSYNYEMKLITFHIFMKEFIALLKNEILPNVVYMLECQKDKCRQRYIGITGRQLKLRLADHRGYITNQVTSKATGAHWNLPGHSLADL